LTLSGSSPFIVTSSADSGPGTLRNAISTAISGETIEFAHSIHSITLTSGELAISKRLDIEGPGASKLTISGNDASRVFDVSGSVTVTIAGMTIANGKAVVTQFYSPDGGGGVLNEAGATLILKNSVLSHNVATTAPGSGLDVCGGGLLNEGTADLNGTTVDGNMATGGGSGTALGGSTGGGIDNYEGGTLFVTKSTITNNEAISAATPVGSSFAYFALGGGIANHAGALNSNPGTVTITNSIVTNNEATGGDGVVIDGGGILNFNETFALPYKLAVMTISNSTVSGNRAMGGDNGTLRR
jgi:hypothetical protein